MSERFDLEQIRAYWTEQARSHGQDSSVSWSDRWAIELEVNQLLEWLADGDHVCDVGCATGYTAIRLALGRAIRVRGIDYIPEMITEARRRLRDLPVELTGRVDFAEGDVRALKEVDGAWDKVTVVRTIINLGDWAAQLGALRECIRVVRSGGLLLLSEATLQGWRKLNAFRGEWGLPEIPMPPFNTYLDEDRVVEALSDRADLVELVNFASTYFVGTRVIKPLLVQALGSDLDVGNPEMEWNRWFASLPPAGDYGTQKLFVFRRI